MLTPRLTSCKNCPDILSLIEEIDCKIFDIGGKLYNNVVFMLNKQVNAELIIDLMIYKRVLTYKYCNPDYAPSYTVAMIASKIKLLKNK